MTDFGVNFEHLEVYQVTKRVTMPGRFYPNIVVATLWQETEATRVLAAINELGYVGKIHQVATLAVDDVIFYDLAQPPVPTKLISETAEEAAALHSWLLAQPEKVFGGVYQQEGYANMDISVPADSVNVTSAELELASDYQPLADLTPVKV